MSAHPAFLQRREDTDAVNVGQVWAWLSSGDYAYSSQPITYGSLAVGLGAVASHPDGTALGEDARATALGTRAEATGHNAVALGADSSASHRNSNSAAIGTDARTTRNNQMVLGTAGNIYTAPGITSQASRAAQSGPRQLLTTDAAGTLASDGGRTFKRLDEHAAGIAMAVAMQNPDLVGAERFGMAAHWGPYEGKAHALAVTALGVLGQGFISPQDRLAVSAGLGVGFENGRGDTVLSGRAGLQWTW